MKTLYEQLGGTYRKESGRLISEMLLKEVLIELESS